MTRGTTPALWALGFVLLVGLVPRAAGAQPAPPAQPAAPAQPAVGETPGRGQMVVVMPFTGPATQDLLTDAEDAVRNALLARGAQVPDRTTVSQAAGVSPPSDPVTLVAFARNMGATHLLTGAVRPLADQYDIALTLYEIPSGRSAHQEGNVGEGNASGTIAQLLTALYAPGALGAAPPNPEEARRQAEERQRQEAERRQREEAQRRTAAQAAADAARGRRATWEAAHPLRPLAAGGPIALGLRLGAGGLLSGTRAVPAGVTSVPAPSSTAFTLRVEGAYALDAVPGLELAATLMFLTTPTAAGGLGVGALYSLPAASRIGLRATAGALVGLFQGISGAQITSAWVAFQARAEYAFSPQFAAFAGLDLDVVPGATGGLTALTAMAGARFRFGAPSAASDAAPPAAPAAPAPELANPPPL